MSRPLLLDEMLGDDIAEQSCSKRLGREAASLRGSLPGFHAALVAIREAVRWENPNFNFARHDYDAETGQRDVPGRAADEGLLADVELAYRQAYEGPPLPPSELPRDPVAIRQGLGDDFVRPFADRLEERLGIDVVRLQDLTTSYCFTMHGRRVIVLAATGNWFRENWSIAHELGHLVADHLGDGLTTAEQSRHEAEANAFAAELLLPAEDLRAVSWSSIAPNDLARFVWERGVSVDALARRVSSRSTTRSPVGWRMPPVAGSPAVWRRPT